MQTRQYITVKDIPDLRNAWIVKLRKDNFDNQVITKENVYHKILKYIFSVSLIPKEFISEYQLQKLNHENKPEGDLLNWKYEKDKENTYNNYVIFLSSAYHSYHELFEVEDFVKYFNGENVSEYGKDYYWRVLTQSEMKLCVDEFYQNEYRFKCNNANW